MENGKWKSKKGKVIIFDDFVIGINFSLFFVFDLVQDISKHKIHKIRS